MRVRRHQWNGGVRGVSGCQGAVIAREPSNLSLRRQHQFTGGGQTAWQGIFTHGHLEKGANDSDPWWRRRCGRLCGAIGSACRCHRHCHRKRRRMRHTLNSIGASRVIDYREAQVRQGSAREGRCGLRLDRWRYTEAVIPRLEGRRPSGVRHPARIAGRDREAPRVGAMMRLAPSGDVLGRIARLLEEGTIRPERRDRVRAPGCGPGLEGHRPEPARGSWDVAQWPGAARRRSHGKIVLRVVYREHEIRGRAYELYLARGAQPGRELEDWLQAERELHG